MSQPDDAEPVVCRECGKVLTAPGSRILRIGPVCIRGETPARHGHARHDGQLELALDTETESYGN